MSTPSRFARWRIPILNERLGYAEPQQPDPDPEDPIDYASQDEGAAVQAGLDVGTPAFVQEKTGHQGASNITVTFDATPEQGNTLIAVLAVRGWTTAATMLSSGWTYWGFVRSGASDGGRMHFWYKTAGGSESSSVVISATDVKDLYIAEWAGLGGIDDWDAQSVVAATTSMTTGTITPTAGRGVIFAGFVQASRNANLTLGGGYTEEMDVDVDPSGPSAVFGSLIVDPFTGSYSTTATSDQSDTYGALIIAFAAASDETTWYPAPAANDGDTGTSDFSDSDGPCLRVALTTERLIYRAELDIGQETAGATVYELYGTDDATFASTTLLATLSFTATGSFTLDTVTATWVPAGSFQYYQLVHISGGGTEREFYEIRLFSAVGVSITDHGELTGREDADQHPADSVSYDNTTSGMTANDVQAAIDELDAAITSGVIVPDDLGTVGATETIDVSVDGPWKQLTLDVNCTITVTGYTVDEAVVAVIKVAQDASGGNSITWDADVVFSGDDQPGLTGLDVTWFLLWSDEGDGVIYGAKIGSSAGLTIEDEGTPLATEATTLDFVGAGVTASGTGAEKTITISGAPTGAAGGDLSGTYPNPSVVDDSHSHTGTTAPGHGALLLVSDHSTPFVFGDILQTSDGTDFLYASG